MKSRTLLECWEETASWLQLNAVPLYSSLNPPASPELLERVATNYNISLPDDLVELYFLHDGQKLSSNSGLMYGLPFLPVDYAMDMYQGMIADSIEQIEFSKFKTIDREIQPTDDSLLSKVPLMGGTDMEAVYVDLKPSPVGVLGQVIFIDLSSQIAIKVADSVADMLCKFQKDLVLEKYSYYGEALHPSKELDLLNSDNLRV